uniref:Uncharacterized protein n=1 Tax=Poecilia reticulata TaxID=8081 RepID=A0A3P9NCE8_POERE
MISLLSLPKDHNPFVPLALDSLTTVSVWEWPLQNGRRPTNLTHSYQFCKEQWVKIQANYCEKIVEGHIWNM